MYKRWLGKITKSGSYCKFMKEDFKKGFSFGAGVLVALLIPTSIFFISSNLWSKFSKSQAARNELKKCIKRENWLSSSEAKKYCTKFLEDRKYQVPF